MSGLGYLVNGFDHGIGLGMKLHEQQQQDQQRQHENQVQNEQLAMQQARFNQQQKLTDFRLQQMQDQKKRNEQLRNINSTLYLANEFAKTGTLTPEQQKLGIQSLNGVYGPELNHNLPANVAHRQIVALTPHPGPNGEPHDGKSIVPIIQTTWKDGHTTTAPLTQDGSENPNAPVAAIPVNNLFGDLVHRKEAISELNAERERLGDNAPLTAQAQDAAAASKRQYQMGLAKMQHNWNEQDLQQKHQWDQQAATENATAAAKLNHTKFMQSLDEIQAKAAAKRSDPKKYNAMFNSAKSALATAFGGKLDKYGVPTIDSSKTRSYLEAIQRADKYIEGGMTPGAAANKAYADVMGPAPKMGQLQANEQATQEAATLEKNKPWSVGNPSTWSSDQNLGGMSKQQWIDKRTAQLQKLGKNAPTPDKAFAGGSSGAGLSTANKQQPTPKAPTKPAAKPAAKPATHAPQLPQTVIDRMPAGKTVRMTKGPYKGYYFTKHANGQVSYRAPGQ